MHQESPYGAPSELQMPRWFNDVDCIIKLICLMCSFDRFAKVEAQALLLHDELWLDTIRYFRNSREIYRHFDDWKNIDCFYFIRLKMSMTYSINGMAIKMAEDPIHLGTFIRNTLEHPDLFTAPCPKCGRLLYPYGYNGSPLSGRVDLEASCDCGWDDFVSVSGWRIRSEALKATQKHDAARYRRFSRHKTGTATIVDLLEMLKE